MSAIQYRNFDRWLKGWDPHQLPPTYLSPRDVADQQVMDARGVRFTRGGSMVWERDQFRVSSPTGKTVVGVLEYRTDYANQMLAFCSDASAHFLTSDWDNASESQWTYGYQLFGAVGWTAITTDAEAVALLAAAGISDAVQAGDALLIAVDEDTRLLRWDGANLTIVGLTAPHLPPTSGGVASGGTGVLSSGTYSYYYTFRDPETGYESMPSPVLDVTVGTDGSKITLTGITDYGDGYYKRIYRAYTVSEAEDARGSDFFFVTELGPGETSDRADYLDSEWTEVDTPGVLAVSANELAGVNVEEDDNAYLYYDALSANIEDFDMRFAFVAENMDDGADVMLWGVTNHATTVATDWTAGLSIILHAVGTGTKQKFYLYFGDVSVSQEQAGILAPGITYYVRVYRAGATLGIEVYDTDDYSWAPPIADTYEPCAETAFRYVYLMCGWGATTKEGDYTITDVYRQYTTTFVDNTPEYSLGPGIAFDHALPPMMKHLTFHKDRVWGSGATQGSESYPDTGAGYYGNCVFYSQLDEPFYWPGDNMLIIGNDDEVVGHASFGDYLVVFKTSSVWAARGWSNNEIRVDLVTAQAGCVAHGAYCASPGGVMWQDVDGYYYWDGTRVTRVLETPADSPWALPDPAVSAPRIAFHDGRFYLLQTSGWLEFEPDRGVWCFHSASYTTKVGLRAYEHGPHQSHVLGVMKWASAGSLEITALDLGAAFTNGATAGTSYSDYRAPVQITLGPLEAPPGHEIIPVEVFADCAYTDDANATLRPKLFLNTDGGYSDAAGANAWETTPDAPTAGEIVGVPPSYPYGASSNRTNVGTRWYVQIEGESAAGFELHGVTVGYLLVRST